MCTMSWLRAGQAYDVFFNRDEKRTRLPAEPPRVRRVGSTQVLAPRDGEAGGSWLAVNEHGLTLALLNGYLGADEAPASPAGNWTSRGNLVMDLADCGSIAELTARLDATPLASFRSFHLVALDRFHASLASWRDGRLERLDEDGFAAPLISSSYRFEEVEKSRREHYTGRTSVEASIAYHRSHVPKRGACSPCMHREDARTVSFSWVRVDAARITLHYSPDSPCRGWPPATTVSI